MNWRNSLNRDNDAVWYIRLWVTIGVFVALITMGLLRYRKRRKESRTQEKPRLHESLAARPRLQGLSEAEAAARQVDGQKKAPEFDAAGSRRRNLRKNLLTIFNLDVLGLAGALWLLGQPLDALLTLGVLFLNIGVNVFQEQRSEKRLDQLVREIQPSATVIREGKVRSIDQSEIVEEDVLVVGIGDEILVDGEILADEQLIVDESIRTGRGYRRHKQAGEMVRAGSFCVAGRAAYEARDVSTVSSFEVSAGEVERSHAELTPLQQIINRFLGILLVAVVLFSTLLLVRYYRSDLVTGSELLIDAISIVFSIAPSSLFFMIVVSYAVGTADIAKLGALVHRSQSVEALAEVTTLCFSKTGILTGMRVSLESANSQVGNEGLAEDRIRHILGDYAHSAQTGDFISRTLADTFAGNRRTVHEEAPYYSVYGWSGITFNNDDLRGTYILGDPDVLQPFLVTDESQSTDSEEEVPKPPVWKKLSSRVGRLFNRSKQTSDDQPTQDVPPDQLSLSIADESEAISPQEMDGGPFPEEDVAPKQTTFKKFLNRAKGVFKRSEQPPEVPADDATPHKEAVLLFAYLPEVSSFYSAGEGPQLPSNLIPLSYLHMSEQILPEAKETVSDFSKNGVEIKILSSDPPDMVAETARHLGLGEDDEMPLCVISGADLANMSEDEFAQAAMDMTVFGGLTPEQKGDVVRTLNERGRHVAMVGDGVHDVPALAEADLSVTMKGGSQAALRVADIVLLTGSLKDLSQVLQKGQHILNGLLDILKLYLTQVSYLLLLIVAFSILWVGLPYTPAQGSLIALVTLTIPSLALTLWAPAGALSEGSMGSRLKRFILPAIILISGFALAVFVFFLKTTQEIAYAQLTMTYALVAFGLLLVLFVRPQLKVSVGADESVGDRRLVLLVVGLFVVFLLFSMTRLAPRFFDIIPLQRLADYLIIGIVAAVWTFALWTTYNARRIGGCLRTKLGGLFNSGVRKPDDSSL